MLRLIVTVLTVSYVSAQLQNICFSNHQQLTEAQVVEKLATLCDYDGNGTMKEAEIVVCFATILDAPLPIATEDILALDYQALLSLAALLDFQVNKHDFVMGWHAYFHDNVEFIGAIFDGFDDDHNEVLSIAELDGILNHIQAKTDDGDLVLTKPEFVSYFMDIYENC